jgi:hypothetical protein
MKIELHIFTNCTDSAPSTAVLRRTHKSFTDSFGLMRPIIHVDPNPRSGHLQRYVHNLQKNFQNIRITRSLSQGYIQAITLSRADYLFMLEHDWEFIPDFIVHTLGQITDCMKREGIYHMRFNKRKNIIAKWDRELRECAVFIPDTHLMYCRTPILSNNPHILHRATYLDFIKNRCIVEKPGSKGIEEIISQHPRTWGAIYGPAGYPATVKHIDGRKQKRGRRRA